MATQAAAPAPADDPDYIDQIDAGKAAVVSPSGDVRTVAIADLPKGVKEGDYVRGGAIVPVPTSAFEGPAIRAKLAAGDTGGPISLDDGAPSPAAAPAPATVQSPLGAIPANTPGLPAPTDDEGTATSGGTGAAPNPEAEKFIDATIAAPPVEGAPPAATAEPGVPPLGPDGLPASSEDIQKRLLAAQAGEGKALEGVGAAQASGAADVAAAQQERDTLRRQQAADLAAQQLYVRDRQQALDAEDAANLQKARDTVIPDFWEGREGSLVGAAIVAALGGAAAGLAGSNHNVALDAITHNVDAYYTRARQTIDDRYKYAEKQGLLNDKMRAQYAGELTDLMQQHAYTLQAAADRVDEVAQAAKGKVDAAQTEYLKAQLGTKSAQELQAARAIDEKNYDSETKRKIAEADLIKANAAMAKVHKGKGGGGGSGDAMAAFIDAAGQLKPGEAIPADLARLGIKAHLKPNQIATEVEKYRNSGAKSEKIAGAGGLADERQAAKEADQWRKENGLDAIAKKQQALASVLDEVKNAPHNPLQQALAVEKAVSDARGGAASRQALQLALHHLGGKWDSIEAMVQGVKSGELGQKQMDNFIGFITNQLGTAQKEGKDKYDAFDQYIASQKPERRAVLEGQRGRLFSGMHGFGGHAINASEGDQSVSAKGVPIVFRGGKWVKQ